MYICRSISSCDLTNEKFNEDPTKMEVIHGNKCINEDETLLSKSEKEAILSSKSQTLDRFARPSVCLHGEKRKKNIFASFRLSKKSTSKRKEDGIAESFFSESQEGKELLENDKKEMKDESNSSSLTTKSRKRYLNRMSSFVSRVATKVNNNNIDANLSYKSKLERSQTLTGTDFSSEKLDYVSFDNEIPGLMGIRNHGNTCFINAVIQCLSHTDILAEYFVLDQYKNDLARCNRINSKKYGTKGEITDHLATLLKSLWVLRYVPDISLNLKNVIEKFEPCYRGSNQHDAAEFLMFILDKVHEDLNTASKRKYKKIKNSYGRPDEIVAAETLANHHRCNSSFVQDIFQAQFRSSLKCPHCLKESNTFDPYLCVSIPIPQHEVLSILITVVYLNQQPKQVKIGIRIEATAAIKQLRHVVSTDCGISSDQMILTEIDGEGFHRTFADTSCVNIIKPLDPIYAIEMTPPSVHETAAFIHITWVNVLIAEPENIRFGGVYQSQVARDVTYEDLQKLLLKEMSPVISSETLTSQQKGGIFGIALDNGSKQEVVFETDLDLPLLHQSVEDSLSICHPMAGPLHIKLVLQWNQENKTKYINDDVDHIDEHSSIDEMSKKPLEYAPVSLTDCLQLHTSAEMLSCGDAWHCPTCNRKQQVLKRLTLWSAPQILVIHLKRFRQASLGANSSKLNTMVNFPLMGFDISDHMAGRIVPPEPKALGGVWSAWKRSKKMTYSETDYVYDLFAVCNHHGRDLQGGHYTAACRNPTSGQWYLFDDFNIEEVAQESVVEQDAYILFYQRREETPPSGSSTKQHWSYRIPNVSLPPTLKIIPNTKENTKDDSQSSLAEVKPTKEPDNLTIDVQELKQEELPLVEETKQCSEPSSPGEGCGNDASQGTQDPPSSSSKEPPSSVPESPKQTSEEKTEKPVCEERPGDSSPDLIPEVRIQPASLEVLASHRMGGRSLGRPSSTCSSTSSDSSGERPKESSSGDEATPEVRIGHRQSKSPSYVIIRTPKVPSNRKLPKRHRETNDDRTNGESGYGSHEDVEPHQKGSPNYPSKVSSKTSKSASYSDRPRAPSKIVKKPNPDPYKCEESFNHYLTESSV